MNKFITMALPPLILLLLFVWQHKTIGSLQETVANQNAVVETLTSGLEQSEKEMAEYKQSVDEVNHEFAEIRNKVELVEDAFSGSDFFGGVVRGDPRKIEKVINKGVDDMFKRIEEASRWE